VRGKKGPLRYILLRGDWIDRLQGDVLGKGIRWEGQRIYFRGDRRGAYVQLWGPGFGEKNEEVHGEKR